MPPPIYSSPDPFTQGNTRFTLETPPTPTMPQMGMQQPPTQVTPPASEFFNSFKTATPFDNYYDTYGRQFRVDPNLIRAMHWVESRFNPNAINPTSGAQGMGQFMPATAKEMGIDPMNPEEAVYGTAKYMSQLQSQFGDPMLAAAAYNMGPGRLQQLGGDYTQVPETNAYVGQLQQLLGMNYTPSPQVGMQPPGMSPMGGMQSSMQSQGQPMQMQGMQMPMQQDPNMAQQQGPPMNAPQGPPMQGQPQQGMQTPGMQGMFGQQGMGQPTQPGTIPFPSPSANPGFWDTLRNAAQRDPYTFYSILADVALMNPQGIKQTMQQRSANILGQEELEEERQSRASREKIAKYEADEATQVRKEKYEEQQEGRDQRYVNSVRERLATAGRLQEVENELGTAIVDVDQARKGEHYLGEQIRRERDTDRKAKFLKQLVSTPDMSPVGEIAKLAQEDSEFANDINTIKATVKEEKKKNAEIVDERLNLTKARLDLAKANLANAKLSPADKVRITKLMADLRIAHSKWTTMYRSVKERELFAKYLPKESRESFDKDVEEMTTMELEYDTVAEEIDAFADALDTGNESPSPPPPRATTSPVTPTPSTSTEPAKGTLSIERIDEIRKKLKKNK